jgi:hypothetical protein
MLARQAKRKALFSLDLSHPLENGAFSVHAEDGT